MTYQDLATRLIELGQNLKKHSDQLSGESAAKLAKTLGDNAAKLQKLLDSAAALDTPDAKLLQQVLDGAGSSLTVAQLVTAGKKAGIKVPGGKTATPAKTRAKFLEAAVAADVAAKAAKLLETLAAASKAPKPETASEEAQRAELRRLGAKSAEEIEIELEERFTEAQVRDLARAAGLKVTKAAKKKGLITKLIPYARRNYENTAMNFRG